MLRVVGFYSGDLVAFGLIGFYYISTIVGYLMPNPFLCIYIKYIGFGLVGFYGISTIVDYLMPNPLYTYISNIYDLVVLDWVLWHINHCWLFNTKSSLYIYIKYIGFDLVVLYGISSVVSFLMPNPFLYIYIKYIGFGWVVCLFGFMAYQPL